MLQMYFMGQFLMWFNTIALFSRTVIIRHQRRRLL